ncbi:class III extradiol ring-cleavage dioxygenase [Spongiibacter sp.]|uniref:DODA-type extradiol aromatic ring-opening family dioxygenase n=1 Tax=Spongiibacter sp. TaxID=2024860 RepID=UPI00356362F3
MSSQPNGASILFIPHGGGPLPLLGDPGHAKLGAFLRRMGEQLPRPEAIVLISAHWEAPQVRLTGGAHPELIYDYQGFPEAAYQLRYPAPGQATLACELQRALSSAGIPAHLDAGRGFDHGMFVPLALMYPDADIPVVQVSLLSSLDGAEHVALGRALQALRERRLLVLGSGATYHNLQAYFAGTMDRRAHADFEQWLHQRCCDPALSDDQRQTALANWQQAPGALHCHPRAEHLLPLQVCAGMASGPAQRVFFDDIMGEPSSAFLWQ